MLKTRITEQYRLKVPFINAGMAFIATAPLVRAVCKAGGMGMLGAAAMPPDVLQAALRDIKGTGPGCYGVNFIARFSGIEHIEVCVREKAPVVAFFWDDPPDEWLSHLRAAGSHIWFQVGSVTEARAACRYDAQALIVQGSEAGGHKRAEAATFSLLPAVIDAVGPVPVIAAGGVADGRTVAAALALGAEAVKLFPASAGGPAYLSALRQPFPDVPFVPVGGVGVAEAEAYLAAGAIAVGVGSPLVGDAASGGDLTALAERAARFVKLAAS